MEYDSLRYTLENMNVSGYGRSDDNDGTLTTLARILKIKSASNRKADIVNSLYRFYSSEANAAGLYFRLGKYETALLTCIVHSHYHPLEEDLRRIADAYGFKEKTGSGYNRYGNNYRTKYFPKGSLLYGFL
ncbi:MAG: hypothetical protein FWH55_02785 [Oscillospiraceae bacterium]|nr:hypothetical protein [Oscillospiraceae bacterium]